MRGADGFSDARIGTTIRTTATMACNTTLSHRPLVERPRGRVSIVRRRTELTLSYRIECRNVLLQRGCCSGSFPQQAKCRRRRDTPRFMLRSGCRVNDACTRAKPCRVICMSAQLAMRRAVPARAADVTYCVVSVRAFGLSISHERAAVAFRKISIASNSRPTSTSNMCIDS